RVSKKAVLIASKVHLSESITALETRKKARIIEKEVFLKEWNSLWSPIGIKPLTPREMRSWLQSQQKLVRDAETVRSLRKEATRLKERLTAHRSSLGECLSALGCGVAAEQGFSGLIEETLAVIRKNEDIEQKRGELQRKLKEFGKQLNDAEKNEGRIQAEKGEWSASWEDAMTELGLAADTAPSEATAFVTRSQDLFAKLDSTLELERRIASIEENMTNFRSSVKQLTERISPDLSSVPAELAASELHSRLSKAVVDNATLTGLNDELSTHEGDLDRARGTISKMEMRVQALLREAKCEKLEQLQEVERKSELAQSLRNTLEQ